MNEQAIADAAEQLAQRWLNTDTGKISKLPEVEQAFALAMAGISVAVSGLMAANPDRAAVQRVLDSIVKAVLDDIEGSEG